jgi:hypothetical protein
MAANRAINSIIDKLYKPWLDDVAYALYTQGLTAQEVAEQAEAFIYDKAGFDFQTTNVGDYLWMSFAPVWGTILSGTSITARLIALINAYDALDVILIRDEIVAATSRHALMCALFDSMNTTGDIDAATYILFKSTVATIDTISPAARDDFLNFLDKAVTLSRIRAAARDAAADSSFDCATCNDTPITPPNHDWSATFDLLAGDCGFSLTTANAAYGKYYAGTGIASGYTKYNGYEYYQFQWQRNIAELCNLVFVAIDWKFDPAARSEGGVPFANLGIVGLTPTVSMGAGAHASMTTYHSPPTGAGNGIKFNITSGIVNSNVGLPLNGASAHQTIISKVRIYGTGTRPASLSAYPA